MLPDIKNVKLKNAILAFKRRFPITRYFWALLSFPLHRSSLHQLGWFKTARKMTSIDADGNPVPWLNYPAIYFLKGKINHLKDSKVWEYGSGNSTIWWSKYSKSVISVEYDKSWKELIQSKTGKNSKIIFNEVNKDYPLTITKNKDMYDVIVIDGRMRVECAEQALNCLTKKGIIIWDNTDRERYQKGIKKIYSAGFKSIDFYGPAPIDNYLTQTSIYYKDNNVLGI